MKFLLRVLAVFFIVFTISVSLFTVQAQAAGKPPPALRAVDKKYVCLTVDDGWNKNNIVKILDTLRKNGVRCTFFIVGSRLKAYPDLWRRAVADGHEICYHTMHHGRLWCMSNKRILSDITAWEKTARTVLGKDYWIPKIARFPGGGGGRNKRLLALFAGKGYKVVLWNVDTMAHRRHVVSYVKKKTRPGAVILTHFTRYDAAAMTKYLPWLKAKFNLVKLSEALGLKPPEPEPSATPS